MSPYTSPPEGAGSGLQPTTQLSRVEKLAFGASAVSVTIVTGYVFLFPGPNSPAWERQVEIGVWGGVLLFYFAVSVNGSLFLIRKGNRASRFVGVLLAAMPCVILLWGVLVQLCGL